jgi:hypothetical protein
MGEKEPRGHGFTRGHDARDSGSSEDDRRHSQRRGAQRRVERRLPIDPAIVIERRQGERRDR